MATASTTAAAATVTKGSQTTINYLRGKRSGGGRGCGRDNGGNDNDNDDDDDDNGDGVRRRLMDAMVNRSVLASGARMGASDKFKRGERIRERGGVLSTCGAVRRHCGV